MVKLHPDARPKRELPAHHAHDSLFELCEKVVFKEGWSKWMNVTRPDPTSELVQIIYTPQEHDSYISDPTIIFTGSESHFENKKISRLFVKSCCLDFLRENQLL